MTKWEPRIHDHHGFMTLTVGYIDWVTQFTHCGAYRAGGHHETMCTKTYRRYYALYKLLDMSLYPGCCTTALTIRARTKSSISDRKLWCHEASRDLKSAEESLSCQYLLSCRSELWCRHTLSMLILLLAHEELCTHCSGGVYPDKPRMELVIVEASICSSFCSTVALLQHLFLQHPLHNSSHPL